MRGPTVNIGKTAIMVFNKSGRILKESHQFNYGDQIILSTNEYCYLGITFTLTESFKTAQQQLKQKGMRVYFALKRTVNYRVLKKKALFKLFYALILPVASYGCQIWAPETAIFREISVNPSKDGFRISSIAKGPMEQLHLSFLKWSLGVGRKTSNAPIWGYYGRVLVGVTLSNQIYCYAKRLRDLEQNKPHS